MEMNTEITEMEGTMKMEVVVTNSSEEVRQKADDEKFKQGNLQISNPNPLLMEDILDKIFVYFRDKPNLTTFRQVSKIWKKSAGRSVKKNLVWKVGPSTATEIMFMNVMSNCSDDMFQNFHWAHSNKTKTSKKLPAIENTSQAQDTVESFLDKFGVKIVTLKLCGEDPMFLQSRLKSVSMPNLEQLEIYHLSEATLKRREPFTGIEHFQKLERLHFSTDVYPYNGVIYNHENPNGRICLDIIGACPNLRSFRSNLSGTVSEFLKRELTTLENLNTTSRLEVGWRYNTMTVLDSADMKNLGANFCNLKQLHVPIPVDIPEQEVYNMLAKSAPHLEKMHVCVCSLEVDDDDDESDTDEDAENAMDEVDEEARNEEIEINNNKKEDNSPILIPEFPQLKHAILHNWRLHENVNLFAKMPNLSFLELRLHHDSVLISPTSPHTIHFNLSSLVFQHHSDRVDEDTVRFFANIFPNLRELEVEVADDGVLAAIFTHMPDLKKLSLSRSAITDCGITGLTELEIKNAYDNHLCLDEVDKIRRKPFIGNLKGLEDFEYNGTNLTKFSLYFGIAWLKDLKWLTFPCHQEEVSVDGKKAYMVHPIDVAPLITHCKYLSKLDVRYITSIYEEAVGEAERLSQTHKSEAGSDSSMSVEDEDEPEEYGNENSSDAPDSQEDDEPDDDGSGSSASDDSRSHTCKYCPLCTKFYKGSQITVESIRLLRDTFPYLELAYDFTEN